jgi:hypothetical protein
LIYDYFVGGFVEMGFFRWRWRFLSIDLGEGAERGERYYYFNWVEIFLCGERN